MFSGVLYSHRFRSLATWRYCGVSRDRPVEIFAPRTGDRVRSPDDVVYLGLTRHCDVKDLCIRWGSNRYLHRIPGLRLCPGGSIVAD